MHATAISDGASTSIASTKSPLLSLAHLNDGRVPHFESVILGGRAVLVSVTAQLLGRV
ncbi:hypothetical protein [Ferrimicrobium sp.]|uniref:hypothetical protein n=1 Tax=Ferrimicrobium sp. TaxID=2926050 RepID=UPI0026027456|nr:hypothetical protein [Ferrimicrobium sp.]